MTATQSDHVIRNGVDVTTLFATLDAVKARPEAAQFRFRAENRWVSGTHSQTTIHGFFGVGEERVHNRPFSMDGDHPEILTGRDNAPTPVEYLLHGLAACITAGIGNIASPRGVELDEVTSVLEGDIDLNGLLGLGDVRNGYQQVRMSVRISGDAPEEKLRQIVEQSRARSAVYDVLANGVPVSIDVTVV